MKRMARVEVSLRGLGAALKFPEGTRVVRTMESIENFSRGTIEVVVEHETLAEVPEGAVIPVVRVDYPDECWETFPFYGDFVQEGERWGT
jgi:hypothetical protein